MLHCEVVKYTVESGINAQTILHNVNDIFHLQNNSNPETTHPIPLALTLPIHPRLNDNELRLVSHPEDARARLSPKL